MISSIFSRITILAFGTLYPAYNSFKTVRAKSVDEYMKWMMYWIVFAIFSAAETFTDVFLAWLPFYYEMKVLLILWLLPSMGNGSPVIYRKCLHPFLKRHEARLDHTLVQLKDKGQDMVFHYVTAAVMYIGKFVMDIVHKNMPNGIMGMMVNHGQQIAADRSIQQVCPNSLLISEEDEQALLAGARPTKRRTAAKATSKHVEDSDGLPTSSRSRARKARSSKHDLDLDVNLNES